MVDISRMQWILWFGQIAAFLIGVVSFVWILGGAFLGVLRLRAEREEYRSTRLID